ncbi:MAG: hypothetical protein LBP95_02190 [Deltaproteobacteria bacterium]|jgi:hypothetical protein|nr:hypothetical protein [Deltaproteobacteria bacterium]
MKKLLPIWGCRPPLFVSDELVQYASILFEIFHTAVPVPLTGKRGRPCNPKLIVDPKLRYATVHKIRKEGKVTKVERKIIFGTPESIANSLLNSNSKTINTSYIERTNLDMRLWDAHLTRKNTKFARSLSHFKAKLNITMCKYNFFKPHTTLTKQANNRPTTPAMFAKIKDCPCSFENLLRTMCC